MFFQTNSQPMTSTDAEVESRLHNPPILLREVVAEEMPSDFHRLLIDNASATPVDQLVLALHTLLLESGFLADPHIQVYYKLMSVHTHTRRLIYFCTSVLSPTLNSSTIATVYIPLYRLWLHLGEPSIITID